jgi:hypothetical protein
MCCCDCVLEIGCCSTAIMEVGPIIEVMRFTFLVIAWQCFKRLEHSFLFARTCPAWSLAMLVVQSSTASYVHLFVFLLVTGFNPAWFGHYGFLEDEGHITVSTETFALKVNSSCNQQAHMSPSSCHALNSISYI